MNSIILKMASVVLKPLFIIVSVWLLLRGHNAPGGGFIGGLIAGSAFMFKPLSYDTEYLTEKDSFWARFYLALGMLLVTCSALVGIFAQGIILEGVWLKFGLPGFNAQIKLGTPLLFDIGVYFTVIGFIYVVFISLMEEWQWK